MIGRWPGVTGRRRGRIPVIRSPGWSRAGTRAGRSSVAGAASSCRPRWRAPRRSVSIEASVLSGIRHHLEHAWPGTTLRNDPAPLRGLLGLDAPAPPRRSTAGSAVRCHVLHSSRCRDGRQGGRVQQSVADLGDPTPHVRLRGPADSFLDGPWSVMDFAAGSLPLGDLNGLASLRRAPGCLPAYRSGSPRRWRPCTPSIPSRRARLLSRPHPAWPGGFQRGLGVEDLFGGFVSGAEVLGRADLADGCRMVADSRPAEVTTVICHGDLHPFHLLVDDGDQ